MRIFAFEETFILVLMLMMMFIGVGGFNINTYRNNRYIFGNDNMISSKFLSYDVKNYHQLIQYPTRVTCSTLTLIDHILTSILQEFPENM